LVLPSFVELITVQDDRTIDLTKVTELLKKDHVKGEIDKIELYYNSGITKIDGKPETATESEL
jgi:CRISPR-associated protein Csh2